MDGPVGAIIVFGRVRPLAGTCSLQGCLEANVAVGERVQDVLSAHVFRLGEEVRVDLMYPRQHALLFVFGRSGQRGQGVLAASGSTTSSESPEEAAPRGFVE